MRHLVLYPASGRFEFLPSASAHLDSAHDHALSSVAISKNLGRTLSLTNQSSLDQRLLGDLGAFRKRREIIEADHLVLYPSHYSGSVCGRGLSANPISTIGFERRHNRALQFDSEDAFVDALVRDIPPAPADQAAIVAANRAGRRLTTR